MTEPLRHRYVDALRGLAATYVLLFHLALTADPPLPLPSYIRWFILGGGTGVSLFFITSAFTLCGSMAARSARATPETAASRLGDYAIRRFFRIAPLFYVLLLVSWLRDASRGVYHPWSSVLYNLTFTFNFVPGEETSFVWAGWTLGVEMVFYVVFPLLFRFVTSVERAVLCLALSIGLAFAYPSLAAWAPPLALLANTFGHFGFFTMLPLFAAGMLAFHLHRRPVAGAADGRSAEGRSVDHRRLSLTLLISAAVAYRVLLLLPGWAPFEVVLFMQAPIFVALLLSLSMVAWPLLVNRVTVFLGTISYSLYLNHSLVLWVLGPLFQWVYRQPVIFVTVRFAICAAIALASTVAVSWVTYRWIEQPGVRLGQWLVARRQAMMAVRQASRAFSRG